MKEMCEKIVEKLKKQNKTIAFMESCTGGLLANSITNVSGASEIIKISLVTYSNEYKIKMGVNPDIIDKYSVYSIETAHEMSKNISKFACSTYGIGITGKINRVDENNLSGKDNEVFVSIYNSKNDTYTDMKIIVPNKPRKEVKELIVNDIMEKLIEIL